MKLWKAYALGILLLILALVFASMTIYGYKTGHLPFQKGVNETAIGEKAVASFRASLVNGAGVVTSDAPGTSVMYKPLSGNTYDAAYLEDTMKIVEPSGFETRPSSTEAAQIATAGWSQTVVDWSKNRVWQTRTDLGMGMMNDFITALEANHVRYFRERKGDSYVIKMPLLKGSTLKAIEIDTVSIQNVVFDNDAKDYKVVFPSEEKQVITKPADTPAPGADPGLMFNSKDYFPAGLSSRWNNLG